MMQTNHTTVMHENAPWSIQVPPKSLLHYHVKNPQPVVLVYILVLALSVPHLWTRLGFIRVLVLRLHEERRQKRRRMSTEDVIDTGSPMDGHYNSNNCEESIDKNFNTSEQGSTGGCAIPAKILNKDPLSTGPPHSRPSPTPIASYPTPATRTVSVPVPCCATEYESRLQDTRQIALHVSRDQWIYRFKPGSIITVSIDEESFSQHSIDERQHLQRGLELTLSTINHLGLGIRFHYIKAEKGEKCGFINVRYAGDGTWAWPDGSTSTSWADTQFPQPDNRWHQYTVNIYSATFQPEYLPVTTNILQHEFAHLLSMRHHPAVPAYKREREQVLFPAGDNDTQSIMGTWTHPGDLFFRPRDIKYLKRFFKLKAGDQIDSMEIVDVAVN